MNITRHNYEEFFLLYVDNELNVSDRKAVEEFVEMNPDLKEELMMLKDTVLPSEKEASLGDKSFLYRHASTTEMVNDTNFEEYFVLYGDDELTNEEKAATELFVYKNPQHQVAFELIQKVRYTADASIVFPDKQLLYRSEKDEKVIVFRWWRVAVAAAVLLFLGISAWLYISTPKNESSIVNSTKEPAVTVPSKTNPVDKEEAIQKSSLADNNTNTEKNSPAVNTTDKKSVIKEVKNKTQESPLLAENVNLPTKNQNESNFPVDSDVTLKGSTIAKVDESNKIQVINTGIAAVNPLPDSPVGPESTNANYVADNTETDKDNFAVLTSNVSSKNKMRGFFRKVTRVVEKATNIGPGEDKKGIHIANFEIALK
ncbi:MAG: hypothetical protein IPP79_02990 [Chitinophagaceae bacterium]|nr:hypothetical protein [Chitinophagaceae bacterium]